MAQVISFSFGYDDNFRGSSLIPWKFVWIETKISLFPRESSSEEQYQYSRCQKINKTITNVLSHSFVPFNFDILRHSMHMFLFRVHSDFHLFAFVCQKNTSKLSIIRLKLERFVYATRPLKSYSNVSSILCASSICLSMNSRQKIIIQKFH